MNMNELIQEPATILVDVRTVMEFQGGNVAGSLNIPLDEIPSRVEEFKAMQGAIIVYCVSGMRSGQALSFLNSHGVENIYNGGRWTDINHLKYQSA